MSRSPQTSRCRCARTAPRSVIHAIHMQAKNDAANMKRCAGAVSMRSDGCRAATHDESLQARTDGGIRRKDDRSEAERNRGIQPFEALDKVFCLIVNLAR